MKDTGLSGVHESFAGEGAKPVKAILQILGLTGSTKRQLELFRGRATYWQLVEWRNGRRHIPQWAVDIMVAAIEAKHAREREPLRKIKAGL